MMAVTRHPDIWAAGVAIVPFVNWFTEVKNEDATLRASDLATMGDPEKNKTLWEDRSPINFVDKIKAPLLLIAVAFVSVSTLKVSNVPSLCRTKPCM